MRRPFEIPTFGYAIGIAGSHEGTAYSPIYLRRHLSAYSNFVWKSTFSASEAIFSHEIPDAIARACLQLGREIRSTVKKGKSFLVIGGDHSSAIGTWSGAAVGMKQKGDLGLIWIDAHLDSHTFKTTPSGNIHGMSLAALLGFGAPRFKKLLKGYRKIKPENLCIIGVRSYEEEELELLNRLNVKIYFMDELERRGFLPVIEEAIQVVTQNTVAFGVSLDVDVFDPSDAPGVGTQAHNGIRFDEFEKGWKRVTTDPAFLGLEIVEFNPLLDLEKKTEKIVIDLIIKTFLSQKSGEQPLE